MSWPRFVIQGRRTIRVGMTDGRNRRLTSHDPNAPGLSGIARVFDAQKAALEAIGTDDAAQQKIFGGNFDRLFN